MCLGIRGVDPPYTPPRDTKTLSCTFYHAPRNTFSGPIPPRWGRLPDDAGHRPARPCRSAPPPSRIVLARFAGCACFLDCGSRCAAVGSVSRRWHGIAFKGEGGQYAHADSEMQRSRRRGHGRNHDGWTEPRLRIFTAHDWHKPGGR